MERIELWQKPETDRKLNDESIDGTERDNTYNELKGLGMVYLANQHRTSPRYLHVSIRMHKVQFTALASPKYGEHLTLLLISSDKAHVRCHISPPSFPDLRLLIQLKHVTRVCEVQWAVR